MGRYNVALFDSWVAVNGNSPNNNPYPIWHSVTVTDTNGCFVVDSIDIRHKYQKIRPFYLDLLGDTILELKFIEDSVSCFNLCDGVVSLETFGGVLAS